tara:strand:- start:41 stop:1579 length:1539 start_codon:yes stop_codon:yes gene_type:complete
VASKLSLRQKRMKSRLNEVEKNFINSTTDADFARNSKLLQSLRTKAKEMGLTTRTDNQLFESMDTTRKDKLKRGKLAGYSKGVYNPETKKREFASAVDDPNKYDIVDFAEHLSYASLGVSGAGLAIKIAKNPKLILELPKNVQAGVRAAYNKLKGTKPMASKKIASLTQKAIFGKSFLTKKAFKAYQDLPDAVQQKILPQITSGNVKSIKAIQEAAEKAQKTLGKASETSQVRKGREALEKATNKKAPKTTSNAKPKTEAPKTEAPKTDAPKTTTTTPKNTNYNINTVKALDKSKDAVNKGGRSVGNKLAIVGGTAATAAALTAGALTSADRRQQSQLNTTSGPAEKKKAPKKVEKSTKDKKSKSVSSVDEMGGGKSNKDKIGKEDPSSAPTEKKKPKKADTKSETRRQKSQLNKPKGRAESVKDQILRQGKRKYGKFTVDSTDEGMSKFMGTKDEIRQQMEDEEMNFNKGGMAKYKKGGMAKAFGKGGMYKTPKKTYGMKNGGFTRRGMGK